MPVFPPVERLSARELVMTPVAYINVYGVEQGCGTCN